MELEKEGSFSDISSIRKRYPDLKGKFLSLVLDASPSPSSSSSPPLLSHRRVGLHLAGHKDPSRMSTYVVGVEPCSVADKDGTIIIGDELLEVNGHVIYGRSHLNSSAIIKSMSGPMLELVIHRDSSALENMAVVPTPSIALFQKDLHQSLSTPAMASSRENKGKQKMIHNNSNDDDDCGSVDGAQQHAEKLTATFSFPGGMSCAPSLKTNTKHPTSAQTPGRTIIDLPLPGQQTEHRHDNNRPQELVKEFIPTLEKQFSGDTVNVRDPKETPTLAVNFNSVLSTKEIAGDAVNDAGKSMPTENGGATNNDDVNGASRNAASRQCSSLLPHSDSLASTDIPFDNEDDDDDDDTSDDLLNQEDVLSHHHHHHLLYHHNTEARSEMRDENPLKTCSVVAGGKAVLIEVDRNNLPVGVLLIGGQDTAMKNVCIKEILTGGAVEADGRLEPGDEILEINGEKVEHLQHSQIQQLMQKTSNSLRVLVRREAQQADHSKSFLNDRFFYDSFTIEVFRKLGKGLGICLRSRTGDRGAVVSHIIRGGPAEADGRLSVGDEITTVNGQEVIEAKVLEIFELIKIMTGRMSLRVIRLKRSLTAPLQSSSPSNSSLIGGFRKSFRKSKENNHTEITK